MASSALVGSCIRSLAEVVGVDRRTTLLRLGLFWTAQHPHVTPATTLSACIYIRPVLSPFLYFPYAGLTYPILLDSRISLVALPQLISFWCRWTTVPTTLVGRLLLPGNGIAVGGLQLLTLAPVAGFVLCPVLYFGESNSPTFLF